MDHRPSESAIVRPAGSAHAVRRLRGLAARRRWTSWRLKRARALGAAPLGRIVSWGVAGVDPDTMGIGSVLASRQALHRAGLGMSTWSRSMKPLDREKSNVNGGAVALGHPVGASGARLCLTLLQELGRRQGRFGFASLCIGGGQGIAMVVEAIHD